MGDKEDIYSNSGGGGRYGNNSNNNAYFLQQQQQQQQQLGYNSGALFDANGLASSLLTQHQQQSSMYATDSRDTLQYGGVVGMGGYGSASASASLHQQLLQQQHQQQQNNRYLGTMLVNSGSSASSATARMPFINNRHVNSSFGGISGHSLLANSGNFQSNGLNSAHLSASVLSGPHHQKQVEYVLQSRQSSSPHFKALSGNSSKIKGSNHVLRENSLKSAHSAHLTREGSASSFGSLDHPPAVPLALERASGWTALDLGGIKIRNISASLFHYHFLTKLFLCHNNLTSLSPLIAKLTLLTHLDLSSNKLTAVPPDLGMLVQLKELLLFDNQLTYLPYELGQLYQLDMLGLEGNPLSEHFASMLYKEGTSALITYLRESCPDGPAPGEREWIILDDDGYTSMDDSYTVMCYNILSDKYATPQSYGYTASWALNWSYRRNLLTMDIISYNADIVCLQEVEGGQFEDYFKNELASGGDYTGVFWPKSRVRTMTDVDQRKSVDGCATFFKTKKFALKEKENIEFQQFALQRDEFKKLADVFNRVMVKDNIAVVCLLEHIETGAHILVANVHLHWDPAYKDVKLLQTAILLEEVQRFSKKWTNAYSLSKLPLLICGDFNSLPDSGVYEFLSQGQVPAGHDDFSTYTYGSYTSEALSHSLALKSAYSHISEMDYTNFTPGFKGVIDYIWYSTSTLTVTGLLSHVDKEYSSKCVGFPNPHHPSDHIPLVISVKAKADARSTARAVHHHYNGNTTTNMTSSLFSNKS